MQMLPHSFHIPVMGLAYTVDSPIKVARFGIPSVISIIEDRLIEMMRRHYYGTLQEKYIPITTHENDYRAKRITDYLNLVNRIVQEQIAKIKASAFEVGSELSKYFEMLPTESKLRKLYFQMLETDGIEKEYLEDYLKSKVTAGTIDVNIMTKLDGKNSGNKGVPAEDGTDAVAALRGYALSDLTNSSIVFSAGLNPRLFNYLEKFDVFDAVAWGEFRKKVVVKVSDYRSALIQGKYLAKKGIWVSEFRIESGLNCGGHAFATDGYLLGPILDEFRNKKEELISALHALYQPAVQAREKPTFAAAHPIIITVQGGIGTHEEDNFLHRHYEVASTGWGTPFLLCPEATTVDQDTLQRLSNANEANLVLSNNSPLGVRFHYLKGTSSDVEKNARIDAGNPGSPCTEKHLAFNTEFTQDPICTASQKYQKLKIAQLQSLNLSEKEYKRQVDQVVAKECLCVGLSNSASIEYRVPFLKKLNSVTICPGPNIAFFSEVVTLRQMTDHIYGRKSVLKDLIRPHMFINELRLYINYLKEQVAESEGDEKRALYNEKFAKNLLEGIAYYKGLVEEIDNAAFVQELIYGEGEIILLMRAASNDEVALA
jgi:hypothetical protein